MARLALVDRKGVAINKATWERYNADHAYRFFKEFDNGKIHVTCEWIGIQRNADTVPRQHWKLFRLNVVNIVSTDGEGRPLPEPRRVADPTATRDFRTEKECVDAYEDILVRYAGCEWLPSSNGEDGRRFLEHGNVLVPPPPDAVDTRGLEKGVSDLAGSW
ncbi:MAG: hypothetical protein M3O74_13850 [Pseudomonadota bacterium]|nr:hypothetical protein [Pseudomonadota bacterium]